MFNKIHHAVTTAAGVSCGSGCSLSGGVPA